MVDVGGKGKLDIELLTRLKLVKDSIIFFCTGFSKHYREEKYFTDYPAMTEELARELVRRKVKMVGFDTPSPDLPTPPFSVHKILLGAGVLIIENLTNLEALLLHKTFTVAASPLNIAADAAPARVIALV